MAAKARHAGKSSREYSKRRAGPKERASGQFVRWSKPKTERGEARVPPPPPQSKRQKNDETQEPVDEVVQNQADGDAQADSSSYEYTTDSEDKGEPAQPVEEKIVAKRYKGRGQGSGEVPAQPKKETEALSITNLQGRPNQGKSLMLQQRMKAFIPMNPRRPQQMRLKQQQPRRMKSRVQKRTAQTRKVPKLVDPA